MVSHSKARLLAALLLLAFAFQFAATAHAQEGGEAALTPQPIWSTVNASGEDNFAGGQEQFYIFVVNSAQNPAENEVVDNMTLSAPFFSNFGPGLPVTLTPGEAVLVTITLPIPSNYTGMSFTANIVTHARIWNGTVYHGVTLTGGARVTVFPYYSQSSTTQTAAQNGTISTTLFEAGVAVPSIVAILLLALVIRSRMGSKPGV